MCNTFGRFIESTLCSLHGNVQKIKISQRLWEKHNILDKGGQNKKKIGLWSCMKLGWGE